MTRAHTHRRLMSVKRTTRSLTQFHATVNASHICAAATHGGTLPQPVPNIGQATAFMAP